MSDFAKNLKKFRKQKNLSQTELSKMLNYGYTAIANYESGRNEPAFDNLIKLAEVLDVTIDELLGVSLSAEEKQLISAFKKLDNEKKENHFEFVEYLSILIRKGIFYFLPTKLTSKSCPKGLLYTARRGLWGGDF